MSSCGSPKSQPFDVRFQGPDGQEDRHLARVVIVASGTWGHPSPAGASGLPAIGEQAASAHIHYGMPDVLGAGTSPALLFLFALVYGGANGMMTILRGTIVQDVLWTEGYGAISGLLSLPSNIAKGTAPISAAKIRAFQQNYLLVEWTIFAVSLVATFAFGLAMFYARHQRAALVAAHGHG